MQYIIYVFLLFLGELSEFFVKVNQYSTGELWKLIMVTKVLFRSSSGWVKVPSQFPFFRQIL